MEEEDVGIGRARRYYHNSLLGQLEARVWAEEKKKKRKGVRSLIRKVDRTPQDPHMVSCSNLNEEKNATLPGFPVRKDAFSVSLFIHICILGQPSLSRYLSMYSIMLLL